MIIPTIQVTLYLKA